MTSVARFLSTVVTAVTLYMALHPAHAADMRDEIVKVTKGSGLFSTKLSVRIYAPRGEGPFPIVIINHGKAPGLASMQKDRGFYPQALEFVKRGYIVVVPTRSGFGSSGGGYISNCAFESMGYAHADDVEAAINYAKTLPYADPRHIVVHGQSQGGLATLALGARNVNGVVGVINTAGGMFNSSCTGDNGFFGLMEAFKSYGAITRVPALFMYGETDEYFPGDRPKRLFDAYTSKGGQAQFFNTGTFNGNSHILFNRAEGIPIWLPVVGHFIQSLGLNWDVKYDLHTPGADPDIEDVDSVPYQHFSEDTRKKYVHFLTLDTRSNRAFAISSDGKSGEGQGRDAPIRALDACRKNGGSACQLYAVGNEVVYRDTHEKNP